MNCICCAAITATPCAPCHSTRGSIPMSKSSDLHSSTAASNFINGAWLPGTGRELFTIDPSNGKQTWASLEATENEVEQACQTARAAFEAWADTPVEERIAICVRFRELLKEHAEALALLISEEVGKPLWESRTEVATMANKIDISVQSYHARTGITQSKIADGDAVLRHRPDGVVNLVNGGRDTGVALGANAHLDGVLFTGSCQTGISLHRQFGGQPGKMLALEMGGNNALVVWDVKDVDAAVHHAIFSAFVSAGQRCTCARRLIVQDNAAGSAFVARLVEVAAKLGIGASDAQPQPFMGPVVSRAVAARLVQAQGDMVAKGSTTLLQMRQLNPQAGFVTAGIVDVTNAVGIPDEEWFGPLLQVIRVADFNAALKVANATEFGLAAALLSDDAVLWQLFQTRARAGIINWNRPTTGAASTAPFGGIGKSGNHRPSAYYAADYCAYPVASIENSALEMPAKLSPGLNF